MMRSVIINIALAICVSSLASQPAISACKTATLRRYTRSNTAINFKESNTNTMLTTTTTSTAPTPPLKTTISSISNQLATTNDTYLAKNTIHSFGGPIDVSTINDKKLLRNSSTTASIVRSETNINSNEFLGPETKQLLRDTITQDDVNDFRLEYNKYKILSHLGIMADTSSMSTSLSSQQRSKLLAAYRSSNPAPSTTFRHKRSLLACSEIKSDKHPCCLEKFYVNFTNIGWDRWILYPAGYEANYCHGDCDLSHARYYHSTLLSKYSNVISLCCSSKEMAPLRLLYVDDENKIHQKSIPDMIVESCDCA